MSSTKSRPRLAPALVALLLVTGLPALVPRAAHGQCMVTGPAMVNSFPPTISVSYMLDTSVTCTSVMNMNVVACFPSAAPNMTTLLVASAMTAATNPTCSWQCNCGVSTPTFSIGPAQGLPVELMEFEIGDEDESTERAEDENAGATD